MNKIYVTFALLVCLSLRISGAPVSPETAYKAAAVFIAGQSKNMPQALMNPKSSATDTRVAVNHADGIVSANSRTNGYVVPLSPRGFVLMRSDDELPPVKLFSFFGSASNIPPDFLECMREELDLESDCLESSAKRDRQTNSVKHKQAWARLVNPKVLEGSILEENSINASITAWEVLVTTTWDQNYPYNYYAPSVSYGLSGYNNRAPAGCVAVAMAQIMRYHSHPSVIAGDPSYYDSGSCYGWRYASDAGLDSYDWANMPNSVNSSSSSAKKQAIGQLLYHCGVSVDMDYESNQSGALSEDVVTALRSNFKYDCENLQARSNVDYETWLGSIVTSINADRPVYYAFESNYGSRHAVVCDGYQVTETGIYIHLIFGWGSSSDGWYSHDNLYIGNDEYYNYDHRAIFGITPRVEPPSKPVNPTPSHGATGQSTTPTLSWSNGGGATYYEVYFGTDSSPDSGEFKVNTTQTTYSPGSLSPNTKYYWRIDAGNDDGLTDGNIWYFTTAAAAPSLSISQSSRDHTSAAASGQTIGVTANVAWTATKTASWITITGGSTGSGNGTVTYSVAVNSGSARSGTITVSGGGITRTFTVNQAGAGTTGILFQDDFNDNSIASSKWTASGYSVTESGQIMQVLTTVTDQGGTLQSKPFVVPGTGTITISRRVFLHYAESPRSDWPGPYFTGRLTIRVGSLAPFAVHYQNYNYSTSDSLARYGIFISRNGASPNNPTQQGDISAQVAPLWDAWFDEKITYNSTSGQLDYFINNSLRRTFNVGVLPIMAAPSMTLEFQAGGWWTGHQQLFDDLVVSKVIETPALFVTPANQPVGSAAGATTFTVSNTGSGTMAYTTSEAASWLSITGGGNGGNSGTITVSYEANTGSEREGIVTVTAPGASGSPKQVKVTQAAKTYAVTYNPNGATSGTVPGSQTKTHGATLTLRTNSGNLAKTGYSFAGWNTLANGSGTSYAAGGSYTANATVTLYAKWTIVGVVATPSFSPDGGSHPGSSVSVTVSCTTAGATIRYTTNGNEPTESTPTTVASGGTVNVPVPGTLKAKAFKSGMNPSATKSSNYTTDYQVDPVLSTGGIGVAFNAPLPEAFATAAKVQVRGLPPGLRYNVSTRLITGVPTRAGIYRVTVTATGVAPATFEITVGALPVWAYGSFSGWVMTDDLRPGLATMTVQSNGRISGRLSFSGWVYNFSTPSYLERDEDGAYRFTAMAKRGRETLPVAFAVHPPADGAPAASLSTVAGELGANRLGDASLWRTVWRDAGAAALLAPYVGYYTATLPGDADYGSGYLAFTVDSSGNVRTAGRLADGTVLSCAGPLVADGQGRFWTVVYTAPGPYLGGVFFGLAEFVDEGSGIFMRPLDGEIFLWQNPNPGATGVYGDGFQRDVGLVGGWYDRLIKLQEAYDKGLVVDEVTLPSLLAQVTYREENDAGRPVTRREQEAFDAQADASPAGLVLAVNAAGSSFMAPRTDAVPRDGGTGEYDYTADPNKDGEFNTAGLTFRFNRSTGLFSGQFRSWYDYISVHDGISGRETWTHLSKVLKYQGILIPGREEPADGIGGRGYYLWPERALNSSNNRYYNYNQSFDFLLLDDQE